MMVRDNDLSSTPRIRKTGLATIVGVVILGAPRDYGVVGGRKKYEDAGLKPGREGRATNRSGLEEWDAIHMITKVSASGDPHTDPHSPIASKMPSEQSQRDAPNDRADPRPHFGRYDSCTVGLTTQVTLSLD